MGYALEACRASGLFHDIYVSTDDPAIASVARDFDATPVERRFELATDAASVMEVAVDFIESWPAQELTELCVVLPTAALLLPEDLRGAYTKFRESGSDFLVSLTEYMEPPFWALHEVGGFLRPYFGQEYMETPSQNLPPVWVDAGYFFIARTEALLRERTIYGPKLTGYPIPRERSVDIDDQSHLRLVEALLRAQSAAGL
jgi:N-acylneuraminate cytidylyltransferase